MSIRVSSPKGQKTDSQRAELEAWLKRHRYKAVQWFEDHDSGTTMQREEFQRLQGAIFAGEIKTVVVWKLYRLARNLKEGVNVEKTPSLSEWSEPVIKTTCLACGTVYDEPIGNMIRACRDCAPIALPSFEAGWTRETLTALCYQTLASGNARLPDEGHWRSCHFCQRKTNLDDVTHFSAPSLCHTCADKLITRHAQGYLDLFAKIVHHIPGA